MRDYLFILVVLLLNVSCSTDIFREQDNPTVYTTLISQNTYFVLKVQIDPPKTSKQIYIRIPDQKHEYLHYDLRGFSSVYTLN